jgi:hypothetical protein
MAIKRSPGCFFAALPFVLLTASAANAGNLEDFYRTQFLMRVCDNSNVEASYEQRENLDLSVEEEVMDVDASSEDIATIFNTLQSEFDANRGRFCRTSEPVAEDVLEEMGN